MFVKRACEEQKGQGVQKRKTDVRNCQELHPLVCTGCWSIKCFDMADPAPVQKWKVYRSPLIVFVGCTNAQVSLGKHVNF